MAERHDLWHFPWAYIIRIKSGSRVPIDMSSIFSIAHLGIAYTHPPPMRSLEGYFRSSRAVFVSYFSEHVLHSYHTWHEHEYQRRCVSVPNDKQLEWKHHNSQANLQYMREGVRGRWVEGHQSWEMVFSVVRAILFWFNDFLLHLRIKSTHGYVSSIWLEQE